MRNLVPLRIEPGPRFNVLAGDNGQGKTNFLEGVYAVCTLRSFRTQRLAEIIAHGSDSAHLEAVVERGGLERHYQLELKPRSRSVRLDGKTARPIARYFGDFNVVLFAPEDLSIPRGSPGDRRRFLDRAVFNRERGFLAAAQSYEKALRSRNALLRDAQKQRSPVKAVDVDLRSAFDAQVAQLGAKLIRARQSYVAALEPLFVTAYESITRSGLEGHIEYQLSSALPREGNIEELAEALRDAIEASLPRDLARGSTSVGPHRDDLAFTLAGHPAASFASQGQMRALVLAWKTAEMTLLESSHRSAPILLLDDVSSELDESRNRYLFEFLRERQNQCFITTTASRYVLLERDRTDFRVIDGAIETG